MRILKFGGTSVGQASAIRHVLEIIRCQQDCVVVVSAMSKVTNQLIELAQKASRREEYAGFLEALESRHFLTARELLRPSLQTNCLLLLKGLLRELEDLLKGVFYVQEISLSVQDEILSFGERLTSILVAEALIDQGIEAEAVDAGDLIITDSNYGQAAVLWDLTGRKISLALAKKGKIPVVTGFIGKNKEGRRTTLGRGGSDYTAAILGACLNAESIEIYTDVSGMYTTDPNQVDAARQIETLAYAEAMELAHFGAKVIYFPTMLPAMKNGIPIHILNTFFPFEGKTRIDRTGDLKSTIKGITSISSISLITISGGSMAGVSGMAGRVFGSLGQARINLILITQASSEVSICFAVEEKMAEASKKVLEEEFRLELKSGDLDPIRIDSDVALLAIVGQGMKNTPGVSSRLFTALGEQKINVKAIAQGSSELNISVALAKADLLPATRAVHKAFFPSRNCLFLAGCGQVGTALLRELGRNQRFSLSGVCNSKHMLLKKNMEPMQALSQLNTGEAFQAEKYIDFMSGQDTLIDCTASRFWPERYLPLLQKGIRIVTANKIGLSDEDLAPSLWPYFRAGQLKIRATVGAGLPFIHLMQDLRLRGEEVEFQALLSGTLGYVFSSMNEGVLFSEALKEAQSLGFCEPDPRSDLSCLDFARKLVILSQALGQPQNLSNVTIEPLLHPDLIQCSLEQFWSNLPQQDPFWSDKIKQTKARREKLFCLAQFKDKNLQIGLHLLPESHPLKDLKNGENALLIRTPSCFDSPILLRGPGAGPTRTQFALLIDLGEL